MPFRDCAFVTDDDVTLKGWYIQQTNRGRLSNKVVVMMHPYNSNKANMLAVARALWEHGYSVFMFDFRSFAEKSTRQSVGFYEQRDAIAAIDYVKGSLGKELDRPIRIGLFGASMGGAVALMTSQKKKVDAVATDCAFASLRDVVVNGMRRMFPYLPDPLLAVSETCFCLFNEIYFSYGVDDVEPIDSVRLSNTPLFLIHSQNDEIVPVEHARDLFENAQTADKDLWVVEGHHIGAYFESPMEYSRRVIAFFDRTLVDPDDETHNHKGVD